MPTQESAPLLDPKFESNLDPNSPPLEIVSEFQPTGDQPPAGRGRRQTAEKGTQANEPERFNINPFLHNLGLNI
ncbi:MAG: hypothetical protein H6863_01160 [Rhodospirillales bacterium]|nr:hypothetical protein [Rhodospirillales bacterium]